MQGIIEQVKRLGLEEFEELEKLELIIPNKEKILVPMNAKEIVKRVGEKLRQEIVQNEKLSDEEKQWTLDQTPTEDEELMLLSVLRDIIVLKLKALDFKIKTEYYVEKPYTQTELEEFQATVVKLANDVFGEDKTENMTEILFNVWNRSRELEQEQRLNLREQKEKFYKEF